jgi:hypothetical protein
MISVPTRHATDRRSRIAHVSITQVIRTGAGPTLIPLARRACHAIDGCTRRPVRAVVRPSKPVEVTLMRGVATRIVVRTEAEAHDRRRQSVGGACRYSSSSPKKSSPNEPK